MKKVLLWGLFLVLFFSVNLNAQKVYKWKLAISWPTGFPIFQEAAVKMAKNVEKMSNGRLLIKVDSKNKHKAAFGILDMVKSGSYVMGHSASYYWKGKDINTVFFSTMPFGMTAPEQYAWFYYGGGMELMKEVYDKHKVLAYPGGNTGNQMGGWFKKEIKSLKDLDGLKMKVPGFAGEVISRLGVLVTNIPAGELYTAIDRGVIDALEWAGPAMDVPMGFHKVAPYYYTGWHEPAGELQFLVNKRKFAKLPKDLQEILINAMKLASYDTYAHGYHENGVQLKNIKENFPKVQIKTLPKDVMKALKRENKKLLKEYAGKNKMFKKILKSQTSYLKQVREWTKISDYTYLKDNI